MIHFLLFAKLTELMETWSSFTNGTVVKWTKDKISLNQDGIIDAKSK
jgi:hypothetical protein